MVFPWVLFLFFMVSFTTLVNHCRQLTGLALRPMSHRRGYLDRALRLTVVRPACATPLWRTEEVWGATVAMHSWSYTRWCRAKIWQSSSCCPVSSGWPGLLLLRVFLSALTVQMQPIAQVFDFQEISSKWNSFQTFSATTRMSFTLSSLPELSKTVRSHLDPDKQATKPRRRLGSSCRRYWRYWYWGTGVAVSEEGLSPADLPAGPLTPPRATHRVRLRCCVEHLTSVAELPPHILSSFLGLFPSLAS